MQEQITYLKNRLKRFYQYIQHLEKELKEVSKWAGFYLEKWNKTKSDNYHLHNTLKDQTTLINSYKDKCATLAELREKDQQYIASLEQQLRKEHNVISLPNPKKKQAK